MFRKKDWETYAITLTVANPGGRIMSYVFFWFFFFLKILFILFFREGKGRREGEKHQCVVASRTPATGDLACDPGMCPDWESNQRPFGSQICAQSTELHQPE